MSSEIEEMKKRVQALEERAKQIEDLTKERDELKNSLAITVKSNEELKTKHDQDVQDAETRGKEELKKDVIKALDQIIVPASVETRFKQISAKILNTDVKRLKRRLQKNGTP